VIDFCDNRGIDFNFGLPGNPVLNRAVDIAADDIRTRRALAQAPVMRGYAETLHSPRQSSQPSACWRFKTPKPLLMGTGQIWQGRVYSRPRGRDFVVVPLIKNNFEGGTDGFGTN